MNGDIIINDKNFTDFINPVVDNEAKGMGLVPRDYEAFPLGYYPEAVPFTLPIIPQNEWQDRLDAQKAAKAQLSDIRNIGNNGQQIPSLDQGNQGYCWAHSTTMASMIARAVNGQPYYTLSAYAVACMIKNYQNQGGWCQQSLKFIAEKGVPTTEFWPQGNKDRKNDNPQTWENAALHITSEWYDLDPHEMKEQMVTCLLSGIPMAGDFNWWGHSVCLLDIVSINPFQIGILNSWGNSWGKNGYGILEAKKALPNGAVAVRVMKGAIK